MIILALSFNSCLLLSKKQPELNKDKYILDLIAKVEFLTLQLEIANEQIARLSAENQVLRSQINSNSNNSSKPPSSDGYTKKPAFPKQEKGTKGGKKGHKGRNLLQVAAPDRVIKCLPDRCKCGHSLANQDSELCEKRQVFDLPQPRLEVTEYQIHKTTCPACGELQKAVAPEGVNAPAQYGTGVKSYAVLLNVHYKMPLKKIQMLFNDLFGYSINEATIYSATSQCYEKLQGSEQAIKSKIIQSAVSHADETGLRVEGKLCWLHATVTNLYTYLFVHNKRGQDALRSHQSILDKLTGWLIHDCWGSYFSFTGCKHGLCGAHILRELQGLIDNHQSKWARIFKSFLMNVYQMPFCERVKRRQHIETRYQKICSLAQKLEPPPVSTIGKRGKPKRTKGRNLLERLLREKMAVLAFAFNKEVPFTNNLAERDIRPTKVKQKISNCFRTHTGANIYARIESFISTTRKHQYSVYSELCATFEGRNFLTA